MYFRTSYYGGVAVFHWYASANYGLPIRLGINLGHTHTHTHTQVVSIEEFFFPITSWFIYLYSGATGPQKRLVAMQQTEVYTHSLCTYIQLLYLYTASDCK